MTQLSNTLLVFIKPARYQGEPEARGLLQFCKGMQAQYRSKGLKVAVVAKGGADRNFMYDAALGEIPFITDEEGPRKTPYA